ncbi:putative acetylcholinesterase [Ixodes scapularis]
MVYFADSTKPVAGDVPIVRTDLGLVAGERITIGDRMVDAFLGIPYAKPPVGDLRFKKPHPVAAWNGTYNATRKPTPCWQQNVRFRDAETDYSDSSEDCLYLNIWRRSFYCENNYNSCGKKRPVVVFIQGGAFQWGDSGLFVYDAANFVSLTDAIYVTFNYRLGIFGFLSLETPELPVALGPAFDIPVSQARQIVRYYFGDYDVEHNSRSVGDIFSRIFGDAVFNCPTQLFADLAAEQGISTYRYMFAHRPSFSVWPEWMGVVHADELAFTLGSLPFAKDETRHTKQLGAHLRRLLLNTTYTAEEETFMRRLVSTWNSFVRNGKPVIPVPGIDWPLYKAESSKLLYLRPGNYTVARDSSRDICELWRPFLLKKMKSTASLHTPSPSKTVNKIPSGSQAGSATRAQVSTPWAAYRPSPVGPTAGLLGQPNSAEGPLAKPTEGPLRKPTWVALVLPPTGDPLGQTTFCRGT